MYPSYGLIKSGLIDFYMLNMKSGESRAADTYTRQYSITETYGFLDFLLAWAGGGGGGGGGNQPTVLLLYL
jgi:hypothetical protein